ncbi:MAG: EthD family reductase [Candidatus Rokubacteria bacterium]|nr:EthD family reductase [Candidatus Rokubacteria bacterium]
MVKLSVIYQGRPGDPAAFDDYYWSKHLPTVGRWPGVRRIELARGESGQEIYQICDIYFDTADALRLALASPERKVSQEDVKRFPPFEGQVKRQVFELRAFRQ